MINLSICPTAYCYGHDTDDKIKEGKTTTNLSLKASFREDMVHLFFTYITKCFPEFT